MNPHAATTEGLVDVRRISAAVWQSFVALEQS